MAKGEGSHSEMACASEKDVVSVIFDHNSPASYISRSRSRSSCGSSRTSGSARHRLRDSRRRRYRSSSSSGSSSSRSTSRPRSRSHPRCYRPSPRCCCNRHQKYGRDRSRHSPPRHTTHYRAYSRSYSRSSSSERQSHPRYNRSRARYMSRRHDRPVNQRQCMVSPSPPRSQVRSHRNRSRSSSSGSSLGLSLEDKRDLLNAARTNSMKILGVENLKLPESIKPMLREQVESESESKRLSLDPKGRVRQSPKKTESEQNHKVGPDGVSNAMISPKRKTIAFSMNNSVAKPTVSAQSFVKVTARVDSYESRKPYGHWVPVKPSRSSKAHKRTL